MRRFLMLVGVGVIAAAMYVAASPASQASRGVSVAKFNALSKKVAVLTKTVDRDGNVLNGLANVYLHRSLHYGMGVTQRGDLGHAGGFAYQYIPQGSTTPVSTTALDLDTSGNPEFLLTPFNATDSACMKLIGIGTRHNSAKLLAQFAQTQ